MRDYSKVSTSIWRSQKFKQLDGDQSAQLLYFYLLTNPHVNSAGCYDLPIAYALEDLKWSEIAYTKAIAALLAANLIACDKAETTVLIVNWVTHNPPTNAKHCINLLNGLAQASSKRLRAVRGREIDALIREKGYDRSKEGGVQVRQLLIAYRESADSLSIGYREGAHSLSIASGTETETETETETKTDTETQTKTETLTKTAAKKRSPPMAALPTGAPSALGGDDDDIPDHLRTNLLMMRRR